MRQVADNASPERTGGRDHDSEVSTSMRVDSEPPVGLHCGEVQLVREVELPIEVVLLCLKSPLQAASSGEMMAPD